MDGRQASGEASTSGGEDTGGIVRPVVDGGRVEMPMPADQDSAGSVSNSRCQ